MWEGGGRRGSGEVGGCEEVREGGGEGGRGEEGEQ